MLFPPDVALHANAVLPRETCYPFDAIVAGGPQRYVLTARAG